MSYIKTKEVLSLLNDLVNECTDKDEFYNRAFDAVDTMPTADVVEVVHAYWKETTHITESKRGREIHSKLYNCSNCDAPNGRKKSSYCHWCGAKMDGERRENDREL